MKRLIFIIPAFIALGSFIYLCLVSGKNGTDNGKVIFTDKAPKPIGPYSQGIMKGNMLFVSGQVGINPATGTLDTSGIEMEAKQAMENIKAILEAAKLNTGNIVKTTIYLTDISKFKTVNDIYGSCFKENPPARETVQVAALPKGAHVEISCIAMN